MVVQLGRAEGNSDLFLDNEEIKPNGDIKICAMDSNNFNFGSVFKQNIKFIYDQNKDIVKELFYLNTPQMNNGVCNDCVNNMFCTNCLIRTISKIKELNSANNSCKWYEKHILENLKNYFIDGSDSLCMKY